MTPIRNNIALWHILAIVTVAFNAEHVDPLIQGVQVNRHAARNGPAFHDTATQIRNGVSQITGGYAKATVVVPHAER